MAYAIVSAMRWYSSFVMGWPSWLECSEESMADTTSSHSDRIL